MTRAEAATAAARALGRMLLPDHADPEPDTFRYDVERDLAAGRADCLAPRERGEVFARVRPCFFSISRHTLNVAFCFYGGIARN